MEEKPDGEIVKAAENLIDEDRVISFSDAVFAFAATLLVLKIDLPAFSPSQLTNANIIKQLVDLWPQYFANVVSFLIIGYYWLSHHAIFSLIKKFDQTIIWINIVFLIFLSFLPFPVDLFGDYGNSQVIIIFYSASLAVAGFLLSSIWIYASSRRLIESGLTSKQLLYYLLRFLLAPVIFLISIPLVFIDPLVAKASWVFVIIGIILINGFFRPKNSTEAGKQSV